MPMIHVELYGMARRHAGCAHLAVHAATVREALERIMTSVPNIGSLIDAGDRPAAQYLLSLNGERFLDDLSERLPNGARLLILSADAGG